MFIKCLLLLIVALIAVQGEISSSRIESDAEQWTLTHRQYMDHAPRETARGLMMTRCSIMNECCPDKRTQFFKLMHTHKFEKVCIGNQVSTTANSRSSKCESEIQHLDKIKNSTEYVQFNKAMSGMPKRAERLRKCRSQMLEVCSADELENHYCKPENMATFRSCKEKVLHLVARDNDEKGYETYVREWKNDYRMYIKRLTKAFPNL